MMNVLIDEKDGRYMADGLGAGKYMLIVIPSAGPALHFESIDLEAGKTISKDIRVKVTKPGAPRGN